MKRKLILLGIASIALSGCNKQIFDFDLKFDKVHILSEHRCCDISQWNDYENSDQIQVKLKDGTILLFHSSSIVLVKGTCPICGGEME